MRSSKSTFFCFNTDKIAPGRYAALLKLLSATTTLAIGLIPPFACASTLPGPSAGVVAAILIAPGGTRFGRGVLATRTAVAPRRRGAASNFVAAVRFIAAGIKLYARALGAAV